MGDFAHLLHIRPWELPLLTVDEFMALILEINETRRLQATSEGGA